MYDALDSDFHNNGLNESRCAVNKYFDNALMISIGLNYYDTSERTLAKV